MIRRRRLVAVASVATIAAAAACQLVAGISDETGSTSFPLVDSAVDGAASDAAEAGPLCPLRTPPPVTGTADVTGSLPLFFAIQRVFTVTDAGIVGYDLDGRCSRDAADVPCKGSIDDYDGGVDNAFLGNAVSFFRTFAMTNDPIVATTNESISAGREGEYLALYGYNRQANDSNVALGLAQSPGLRRTGCGDASVAAGPGGPKWDGCDIWSIGDAVELTPGNLADAIKGYVSDHTLVARYGTQPLILRFSGTELRLDDATVVATIADRGAGNGPYELVDGVVTGRATASGLISMLASATFKSNGVATPICTDPNKLSVARSNICTSRDLRAAETAYCRVKSRSSSRRP